MATKGPSRRRLPPSETRGLLAQNVSRMMDSRYKDEGNRPMALAREAGVSLSTVQRTLSGKANTTIDVMEAFAKVFGVPVYQVLVPWGLLGELAIRPADASAVDGRRKPLFRGAAGVRRDNALSARKRRRAE